MASATVNGMALAVNYVGNGGGGAASHDDSSPDDRHLSLYDDSENVDQHHHHHRIKEAADEDDMDVVHHSSVKQERKRSSASSVTSFDGFTPPSQSSAALSQERSKKRRKQSNPVRLSTSRVCSDQEGLEFADGQRENVEGSPPICDNATVHVSGGADLDEEVDDGEVSTREDYDDGRVYRCHHCNVLFEEEERLHEHVEEEHVQKALERQIQQQNQKNICGTIASSNPSSSHNASPFDLSASSAALRPDRDCSSEPSILEEKLQHHNATSTLSSASAVALHSPKDMAGLMALSAFGSAPFLIPVLPCGNASSVATAAASRFAPSTTISGTSIPGSMTGTVAPSTGPPIRIFNPEAFCELCNKEFCNKYFLKTHKANKHGIYSAEALAGVASTISTSGSPSLVTSVASFAGSNSLPSGNLIRGSASQDVLGAVTSACGTVTSSSASVNNSLGSSLTISGQNVVTAANSGIPGGNISGANSTPGILLGNAVVGKGLPVMNPEAFCDICQKEFCNKYFLKKHRQKIHGILDPISGSPFSSLASSVNSVAALVDSCQNSSSEMNTISTAINLNNSSHHPPLPDLFYEFGARDLSAKIAAFTQGLMPKHSIQSLVAPSGSTSTTAAATTTTATTLSTISTVPASHFTSGMGGSGAGAEKAIAGGGILVAGHVFSPERLREMGVINVDAFCEICCKEFCNKYFLRTHKMNKHGIGMAGMDIPPTLTAAMLGMPPLPHQQSAPLSLVMEKENAVEEGQKSATPASSSSHSSNGSINGQGSVEVARPPSNSQDSTHESSTISTDLSCEVCNRPFSSPYLLKMHKFYFHNIGEPLASVSTDNGLPNCTNEPVSTMTSTKSLVPPSPEASDGRCGSGSSIKSENDAISGITGAAAPPLNEDLQKLQTMIRELNTSPKDGSVKCSICFREMKNKYFLRAHMMNEHGELHSEDEIALGDKNLREELAGIGAASGLEQERDEYVTTPNNSLSIGSIPTPKSTSGGIDPESYCELCCKEFCSKYFLRTHKMTVHGMGLSVREINEANMPSIPLPIPLDKIKTEISGKPPTPTTTATMAATSPGFQSLIIAQSNIPTLSFAERPPITAITGRNFCEICNKELCNKYFMKTHMLKMHGINVDEKTGINGATIGGVTCDICQKELCSKYFLKVHKQNTHGIFEEPTMTKESYVAAAAAAAAAAVAASIPASVDKDNPNYNMGNSGDGNMSDGGSSNGNRYFSHYTEVCPLCDRRFKSIKWLKTHVINDHADLAKENGLMEVLGADGPFSSGNSADASPHSSRSHHLSPRDYAIGMEQQSVVGIKTEKSSSSSSSATTSPNTTSPFLPHIHHQQQPSHRPLPYFGHMADNENIGGGESTSAIHHAGELGSTGAAAAGTKVVTGAPVTGTSTSSSSSPSASTCTTTTISVTGSTSISGFTALRKPLGSGNGTRIYHCSYCSYSTRWLSNLYAHEKRHTGLSSEGEKRFCCRVCHRAYRYNHSLQRHLVSHKTTGILLKHVVSNQNFASPHNITTSVINRHQNLASVSSLSHQGHSVGQAVASAQHVRSNDKKDSNISVPLAATSTKSSIPSSGDVTSGMQPIKNAPSRVKKYRCSKCGAKYRSRELCLEHIHQHHNTRNRNHKNGDNNNAAVGGSVSSAPKSLLNCLLCPFSCSSREALASHLSSHQRDEVDHDEDRPGITLDGGSDDETSQQQLQQQHLQQLQRAFGRSQLPMTYAVPQTPPTAGSFIMQPFLISQSENNDGASADRKTPPSSTFVPSLVYLPVSHKVSETVTVTFNLTPA